MRDAFEIVMEDVPGGRVPTVLEGIGHMAESVSWTELEGESMAAGERSAESSDEVACSSCVIYTVKGLRVGAVLRIPTLLIRVLGFEGRVSIDFSFDMDWADVGAAMSELQRHFLQLKMLSGAETVYGGMEPAQDMDTRFFTDAERGPLRVTDA